MRGTKLEVLDMKGFWQWKLRRTILSDFLKNFYKHRRRSLKILDAGCGNISNMDLGGVDHVLTGIDISLTELLKRKRERNDLNHMVVGDLQTLELRNPDYDVIYCFYAFEHLENAQNVLDKFFQWLKLGGLLLLAIPDRDTVFGFITRKTPLKFHKFYYRMLRQKKVGGSKCAHVPIETHYNKIVSRKGIHRYCKKNEIKILLEYGTKFHSKSIFGIFYPIVNGISKIIEIVSLGKISSGHSGLFYVIRNGR